MSSVKQNTDAATQARARVRKKSFTILVIASTIVVSILGAMGYLVYATAHNNKLLADSVALYQDQFISMDPVARSKMLESAYLYNDDLSTRPLIPPPIGQDHTHQRWDDYVAELSGVDGQMGTLTIPAHNIALPVYHGTSDEVLDLGAGHLFGTHLPVGARTGEDLDAYADTLATTGITAAISAHTGLYNKSMFDNLQYMKNGDLALINVAGEQIGYRMISRKVVGPDDLNAIDTVPGKDYLQLITCTPYGINFNRLVVTLERMDDDALAALSPQDQEVSSGVTDNVSGLTIGATAASVFVVLVWLVIMLWERRIRRRSYAIINQHYFNKKLHDL